MGVCSSQHIERQQSDIEVYQQCDRLKQIITFMARRSEPQAQQFEEQLKQNNIQTYKDLLIVVKEGKFPDFKGLYYQEMSKPQQNKFDDEYYNLIMEAQQDIEYKYTVYSSQGKKGIDLYLLVIGITGNGKTTFINSLCSSLTLEGKQNYIESVKQILVDDKEQQKTGKSVTKEIKKYSIYTNYKGKCYCINLIDTPGLNDTAGTNQDQTMVLYFLNQIDQLGKYLTNTDEVPHLDLILFVSKEQETYNQQERISMQSVVKLLGIDTPKYTKQILTFSELSKNINEDKFKDKVLQLFYEKQTEPKYYQFQNSLMIMEGKVSYIDTLRLQKNLNHYKMFMGGKFFSKPDNDHLNLKETKNVIFFRKQIKEQLFQLGQDLKLLVKMLLVNKRNKIQFNDYETQIQRSSNFTYQKEVVEIDEKKCEDGFTTTFCRICDKTCHDRCEIKNERDGCIVFINKKCYSGVCGHPISDHDKSDVIRTHKIVIKTFEYKDLKDAFDSALKFKQQIENEINLLDEEQQKLRENICLILGFVLIRDQQLRESALFHEIQSNADEYYMDEIKQQYITQSNFVTEIDAVRELYKQNKEKYLAKAKQQLEQLENK